MKPIQTIGEQLLQISENGVGDPAVLDFGNSRMKTRGYNPNHPQRFVGGTIENVHAQISRDTYFQLCEDAIREGYINPEVVAVNGLKDEDGKNQTKYFALGETAIRTGGHRIINGHMKYKPDIIKPLIAASLFILFGEAIESLDAISVYTLMPPEERIDAEKELASVVAGRISFEVCGKYNAKVAVTCDISPEAKPRGVQIEAKGGYMNHTIGFKPEGNLFYNMERVSGGYVVCDIGGGTFQIVVIDNSGKTVFKQAWKSGFNAILEDLNRVILRHTELVKVLEGLSPVPDNLLQDAVRYGGFIVGQRFGDAELDKKWFHRIDVNGKPVELLDLRAQVKAATNPHLDKFHLFWQQALPKIAAAKAVRLVLSGAGNISLGERLRDRLNWSNDQTAYADQSMVDMEGANAVGVVKLVWLARQREEQKR